MSDIIGIKLKLKDNRWGLNASEFLFDITSYACGRNIAVKYLELSSEKDNILYAFIDNLEDNEMLLMVFDSFNRELAEPLIGLDEDYDVKQYGKGPLLKRLLNLQALLEYIFNKEIVLGMEFLLSSEDLRFDNECVDVELREFAEYVDSYLNETKCASFNHQFHWNKG